MRPSTTTGAVMRCARSNVSFGSASRTAARSLAPKGSPFTVMQRPASAGTFTVPRAAVRPKFLTGSDGILLIRQEIIQSSISNYWQQGEQRIGLGLQRSRLWHLLKAWGGVFRFQPIGHACSTG